jgi:hypothetical protein
VSDWPACDCRNFCGCAGGIHNFADAYRRVLEAVRPRIIVEWGPGYSTRIAREHPSVERIVSIEHSHRWFRRHRRATRRDRRVLSYYIPLDVPGYASRHVRQDADICFVDGRQRAKCLVAASIYANPGAVVCLHDAQRRRYHAALGLFPYVRFLDRGFAVASCSPLPEALCE